MLDIQADFLRFIWELKAALPGLMQSETPRLRVIYNPTKATSGANEILLGLGTSGGRLEDAGVVLQNKRSQRSVTATILNATAMELSDWRQRLGQPATLAELQATLYVEDASPDTTLSLVFFLARLFGVSPDALPLLWCDYVTCWEAGDVRTTGQPFASWGCLQSALGHSYATEQGAERTGVEAALPQCLHYLLSLLALGIDPAQVPEELPLETHHAARLQLQQEYQTYQHTLNSAEMLQLRVPLPGDRRYRLVDAFIATEVLESGSSKAFIRSDTEHTWFRQGFSLMAVYRLLANRGEDITVSTDPGSGIYLKELWETLEALENQRWGDDRPRDNPRDTLGSYPAGRDGTRPAPNQPWYDGTKSGIYTLIAAPKSLGEKYQNQPGSKLSWREVREQIWVCYNPARDLRFTPYHGASHAPGQALHTIPATVEGDKRLMAEGDKRLMAEGDKRLVAEGDKRLVAEGDKRLMAEGDKRLVLVGWDAWNSEPLVLTPTLQRYLAACAAKAYPDGVPLSELPELSTFDFLKMPGGYAVVHRNGVLLMDDWSSTDLDVAACQEEFTRVSRRWQELHQIDQETTEMVKTLKAALNGGQALKYRDLVQRLSYQRLQLHTTLFETGVESKDVHVLKFRGLLEARWGLSAQLQDLHSTLEQLDALVRNHLELRTSRLINGLTIYGFPIALVTSIFSDNILQNWGQDGTGLGGIHWLGVGVSVVLCVALIGLLRWMSHCLQRARLDKN